MKEQPLRNELSKLLREQESLVASDAAPLAIEQNNKEIWELRTKYACGSTWGKDPAFDKWWVKQVAKARHLNIVRQIAIAIAVSSVAAWLIYVEKVSQDNAREFDRTHPDAEYVPDYPDRY